MMKKAVMVLLLLSIYGCGESYEPRIVIAADAIDEIKAAIERGKL